MQPKSDRPRQRLAAEPQDQASAHNGTVDADHATDQKRVMGIGREAVGRRKDGSVFPMNIAIGETTRGGGHAYFGIVAISPSRRRPMPLGRGAHPRRALPASPRPSFSRACRTSSGRR